MRKFFLHFTLLTVAILLSAAYLNAQISHGGIPSSLKNTKTTLSKVKYKTVYASNLPQLKADDATRDKTKSYPWRFGENIDVNYTLDNSGEWDILPNGEKIWRLGIYSPGALSINLTYNDFYIPEGGKLYIYNTDKSEIIGAFTHENNKEHRKFATTLMSGEAVILEYNEGASISSKASISVSRVTHGYRNAFDYAEKALGSSGSCNNNVVCPESAGWEDQIRSVAMMVSGGSGFCTGALVNNTAEDGTPYFLTADHCYSDPTTWIFWFNWQSATCTNPGTSPPHDDISSATLRARNADSDFLLVELSSIPPTSYNIYYAGWNREDIPSTSSVGIHHPSGDIKKISFDYDPSTSSDYLGSGVADSHWKISSWDDGTTEPGSSGSPLFDQNHRVTGQLHGGYASCTSLTEDVYGKFSMSWDRGGNSTNQLLDWLDPSGTNPLVIDGYDPNAVTVNTDAQMLIITVPANSYCGVQTVNPTVTIKNKGINTLTSLTVSYDIDGGTPVTQNWTGSLATNATADVVFPAITLTIGAHTLNAGTSNPNGTIDENTANDNLSKNYDVFSSSGSLPYVELFESGTFPPPCWDSFIGTNGLGTTNNWVTSATSYEGSVAAYVQYENVVGGVTEDWLVTPLLDLTGTTSNFLSFYERQTYNIDYGGAYSIKVSTNSQSTHADFSDVIAYVEADFTTTYAKRTVDLSAYDGQNIYIAFVMSQDDGDDWFIDSVLVNGTVSVAPVANFVAATTTVCNAGSTVFTDLSTNSPTSWSWTFNPTTVTYINATNANSQNPEVQFDVAGTYSVTLAATNANGSDVFTQISYITVSNSLPVSNAITEDANPICAGDNVIFTSTPTNEGTSPTYQWQVNGTNVGTGSTYSSTSINDGDIVTCILTSSLGCATGNPATSNSVSITVIALPIANFIFATNNADVTFTNSSTNTTSYYWDFGDGTFDTTSDPTHTYGADGSYTVTLIAANNCGSDTSVQLIDIVTYIKGLESDYFIDIYPNPNNGNFTVKYVNNKLEDITLKIFNSNGQLIHNEFFKKPTDVIIKNIELSDYSKGIYHLQIITDSITFNKKIIFD